MALTGRAPRRRMDGETWSTTTSESKASTAACAVGGHEHPPVDARGGERARAGRGTAAGSARSQRWSSKRAQSSRGSGAASVTMTGSGPTCVPQRRRCPPAPSAVWSWTVAQLPDARQRRGRPCRRRSAAVTSRGRADGELGRAAARTPASDQRHDERQAEGEVAPAPLGDAALGVLGEQHAAPAGGHHPEHQPGGTAVDRGRAPPARPTTPTSSSGNAISRPGIGARRASAPRGSRRAPPRRRPARRRRRSARRRMAHGGQHREQHAEHHDHGGGRLPGGRGAEPGGDEAVDAAPRSAPPRDRARTAPVDPTVPPTIRSAERRRRAAAAASAGRADQHRRRRRPTAAAPRRPTTTTPPRASTLVKITASVRSSPATRGQHRGREHQPHRGRRRRVERPMATSATVAHAMAAAARLWAITQ